MHRCWYTTKVETRTHDLRLHGFQPVTSTENLLNEIKYRQKQISNKYRQCVCTYVENNYILSPGHLLLEAKHQTSMENMHVENNYILSTGCWYTSQTRRQRTSLIDILNPGSNLTLHQCRRILVGLAVTLGFDQIF